jgi:nucleoside 2-deoxyribosyltransferase
MANAQGILGADIVLVLGYKMGRDTAWEVGFATAHGIPIVLVYSPTAVPENDIMLFHSASAVFRVSPEDITALLPQLLDSLMAKLRGQLQGE